MTNLSFEFEIFGKVQKVFFRKYTQQKAQELGLVGWVKNTKAGTVVGSAQGAKEQMDKFKTWLMTKG